MLNVDEKSLVGNGHLLNSGSTPLLFHIKA